MGEVRLRLSLLGYLLQQGASTASTPTASGQPTRVAGGDGPQAQLQQEGGAAALARHAVHLQSVMGGWVGGGRPKPPCCSG